MRKTVHVLTKTFPPLSEFTTYPLWTAVHAVVVRALIEWRKLSPYSGDQDYLFPSIAKNGLQPLQPDTLLKRHIRPALRELGITKRIGWHSFRHGLAVMLRRRGVDLKTAQELLRHANSRITLEVYNQSLSDEKRTARNPCSIWFWETGCFSSLKHPGRGA